MINYTNYKFYSIIRARCGDDPKDKSHYIHDCGHLTQFTSYLKVWWSGSDEFMYGNVKGKGQYPTPWNDRRIRTHSFIITSICTLFRNPPTFTLQKNAAKNTNYIKKCFKLNSVQKTQWAPTVKFKILF